MIPASAPWTARWIEPPEGPDGPAVQRPGHHLAGEFTVPTEPVGATLRITAHGLVEAFVNGRRVGDHELTPGFTAYRRRLQVITFDASALVHEGTNAMGVLLTDGWWRGQHGIARTVDAYGTTVAVLAELHVRLADGTTVVVGTDGSWRCTTGHVRGADLVAGEVHDLRRRVPGWADAGTDRTAWQPVREVDHGTAALCDPVGPPCRRVEEVPAVAVTELAPGRHVVDLGRNINGWVRVGNLGPVGTTLTLVHGEALDGDGDVTVDNVARSPMAPPRSVPFQTDVVVSAGDGTGFEPRHSTKGFRYVRVEGHPGPLAVHDVTGVMVHSDLRRVGGFTCSDPLVNRLHAACDLSFRGNACEIPTDCPTRERSGWTGDWQLFVATAAELYDVTDWSVKWLRDVAAEQLPDGAVLHIVPDPHDFTAAGRDWWRDMQGSAGWGDAICHVPWELHLATGRTDVLEEFLPAMRRWVDFAAHRAATGRHRSRVAERPEPLPHEAFLWDSGFHFGEWLEPGVPVAEELARVRRMDHGATATAYLHRSAGELARAAEVLGRDDLARTYAHLAEQVRAAWCTEFLAADGAALPATQATLVRALAFDLVPPDRRAAVADRLVTLVREADTHLGTGFLATPFLLPVLAATGHLDVAYEVLLQRTEPGWLVMIDRGATTVWEEWEGVKADGSVSASLNHYSKGAVASFLHRTVAGLERTSPGWRSVRVAPHPGGGITHASTWHDAPHGRIEVAWRVEAGIGSVDVVLPPGTTGAVHLPDGATADLAPGRATHRWTAPG